LKTKIDEFPALDFQKLKREFETKKKELELKIEKLECALGTKEDENSRLGTRLKQQQDQMKLSTAHVKNANVTILLKG